MAKARLVFYRKCQYTIPLLVQLSDNIVHERDLLQVNKRWKGFYPEYTEQLVDWFMREFRPASFRQDRAKDLQAVVLYKLYGIGEGQWTMIIERGQCKVTEEFQEKLIFALRLTLKI